VWEIIEQVALNESISLLKIILQNKQTLQLFTKIIKKEMIYKSNCIAQIERFGQRDLLV